MAFFFDETSNLTTRKKDENIMYNVKIYKRNKEVFRDSTPATYIEVQHFLQNSRKNLKYYIIVITPVTEDN